MSVLSFVVTGVILTANIAIAGNSEVELSRCIDGDTAAFLINENIENVRFLAIDTPESTNKIEPYGKIASEFTCDELEKAEMIELELETTNKRDRYNRLLAWVFVDGKLLQGKLVEKGYAKVAYLYGDYLYTEELQRGEEEAKRRKLNIWSDTRDFPIWIYYVASILAMVIVLLGGKKRTIRKMTKILKSYK